MRIKILRDHDYRIKPARIQAFKAGNEPNVPKKAAEHLIEIGVAELADTPKSQED